MQHRTRRQETQTAGASGTRRRTAGGRSGAESLVDVVRRLSAAQTHVEIAAIVRTAARELVGADGATFILKDHDHCHYVDEDAIGPLWKGQRFPLTSCIGGWSMLHREPVVIEDVYADDRIPHGAYRQTFVRSLVIVPIRAADPMGAIGTYWATQRMATDAEVELLEALADTTSVAMANVSLLTTVDSKTAINRELQSFTAAAAHDLRSPLTTILGLATYAHGQPLEREELDEILSEIAQAGERMRDLISDLLHLSRATAADLRVDRVDLGSLARTVAQEIADRNDPRVVRVDVADGLACRADRQLLRIVLENLLGNAWKYTSRRDGGRVWVGATDTAEGRVFFVRDNGAGFDPARADELFRPFRRLHDASEFEGNGIGLTTVKRIVERHGGRVWAEGRPGLGATVFFRLDAA